MTRLHDDFATRYLSELSYHHLSAWQVPLCAVSVSAAYLSNVFLYLSCLKDYNPT